MDMTGEYRIAAPRQKVWEALNDPDILKQSIPGCEEIDKDSDTSFTAKVTAKLGPVKAKFGGAVTLSDLNPPESYTISGEGKGGAAGFAKGGAKVHLAEDGDETVLTYEVNASVGGKIAQLGGRLIDSTARKMADQFFSKFAEIVAAGPDQSEQPAALAEPTTSPMPPEPTAPVQPKAEPTAVEEPAAAPDADEERGTESVSRHIHEKMEEARTEESVSMTNPYLWVGAVIGLVILLLILWAVGVF